MLVKGWSCDCEVISSVQAFDVGGGYTVVHIDLTTDGKGAEVVCFGSDSHNECNVLATLAVRPVVGECRVEVPIDAHLILQTGRPTQVFAHSEGRYTIFILLHAADTQLELGAVVPRSQV